MKSVMAEAATISKAVEEAWKKAGNPIEFFTKIVEEPKAGFLGFGAKNAVIALFFNKESIKTEADKLAKPEVVRQESYVGFFNNKNLTVENVPGKQPQKQQQKQPQKKANPAGAQQPQAQNQRRKETASESSNSQVNQSRNQNRNQNNQQRNQNSSSNRPVQASAVQGEGSSVSEKREPRVQRPQHQSANRDNQSANRGNNNQNRSNQNRNNQNKRSENDQRVQNPGLPRSEDN